jgi:Cu-Zn family superoxide dismutase
MLLNYKSVLFVVACAFMFSGQTAFAVVKKIAKAELLFADNNKVAGSVTFVALGANKIKVTGSVDGLSVGKHGMHIHEIGDCSDFANGFKKSGGHFNPDAASHGTLMSGHAGDLGNIEVDAKGHSSFNIETSKFNLNVGDKHNVLGKALVIHAGIDDEKSNPAGNSGARILCGVIR